MAREADPEALIAARGVLLEAVTSSIMGRLGIGAI